MGTNRQTNSYLKFNVDRFPYIKDINYFSNQCSHECFDVVQQNFNTNRTMSCTWNTNTNIWLLLSSKHSLKCWNPNEIIARLQVPRRFTLKTTEGELIRYYITRTRIFRTFCRKFNVFWGNILTMNISKNIQVNAIKYEWRRHFLENISFPKKFSS